MKKWSGERGFTLVELLISVAIVSMLIAFAAPRIYAANVRSREARVQQDLVAIQSGLERHYLDHTYYPIRLNDLVERGYLEPSNLRSPLSGHWYFYAVDDNREDGLAKAYALGAPPRNAYKETYKTLFRGNREIPEGRKPTAKARAWLRWEIKQGDVDWLRIYLKYENDHHLIHDQGDLPTSLADYRFSCRPTATVRCDLFTN